MHWRWWQAIDEGLGGSRPLQAYFYKLLNEISNSHVTDEISELASLLYSRKDEKKKKSLVLTPFWLTCGNT